MKKLALLLLPAALWASGCGDSCTNKSTQARAPASSTCTVAGGGPVTINVTPACASCADDSPRCDITPTGAVGQEQLDIKVRECDSNKGCNAASCTFGAVNCAFTPPPASTTIEVVYLTGGSSGTLTVNIGGGAGNSCTIPTS